MSVEWPPHTAVLVPGYQAAPTLRVFLPQLLAYVPSERVVVVDDGSGDNTPEMCRGYGVTCLAHSVNRGKGAALRTGFEFLAWHGFRWAITMDADGQHSVSDIPYFVEALTTGPYPCLWIGRRSRKIRVMPLARICSNTITSAILTLMTGVRIDDSQCGFRAYPLEAVQRTTLVYDRFEMESEVILRLSHAGCPIRFVPIRTVYCGGRSHIAHVRDTLRWTAAVIRVWSQLRFTQR